MKKIAAGCLAVACVLAVLVVLLTGLGSLREERQRDLPPMTVRDLDQIARQMTTATDPAKPQTGVETPPIEPASPLPRRLARPATSEERREFFSRTHSYGMSDNVFGYVASSPLGAMADAAALVAGVPDGASWTRAQAALIRGRWAEARGYFEEVVRKSNSPALQKGACGYLAWVEDDPELAARCMEIACSGGQDFCFSFSAELARVTGSTELAEYYQSLSDKARAVDKSR